MFKFGFLIVNSLFLPVVVMAVVLMLGLEVTVWADEDDDEKAEMRDFVAAVYRGRVSTTWRDRSRRVRVG